MAKFKVHYTNTTGESKHAIVVEADKPEDAANKIREAVPGAIIVKTKAWKAD